MTKAAITRILAAITLAAVFVLAGCSAISSGYVTNKVNSPSYTYISYICGSYNSKGICVSQVPIWNTVPERWKLDLRNSEGEEGYVYVTESTYNSYSVGDYYQGE